VARDGSLLGTFAEPAGAARAVRALLAAGFRVETAMPAPFPEVIAALARPKSGLGAVTLSGALLGLLAGVLLTVGTSVAWPLVTGGKPIVSVPPFAIVVFEVTVLVGSLTNLVAVAAGAGLGARRQATVARAGGVGDRIAVVASAGDASAARRILRESGAEEVRDVE
jgi:ActD protein